MRDDYDFWRYEPADPIKVKGGIKAQSSVRGFAQKWWGRRWISVLEGFQIGARLGRGKSYARKGQVMDLDIGKGTITARVQGTRREPYKVIIKLNAFGEKDWDTIVEKLAEQPALAAQLLANEMPQGIEEAFQAMKRPLFPERHDDLKTDCSCPDWSNPCKHIAAVYYLLAEAFDDYPFLLFRLRGTEMEDFLFRLRGRGGGKETEAEIEADELPLPPEMEKFWRKGETPEPAGEILIPPETHAHLPKRLGSIPFWRSDLNFHEAMEGIYKAASIESIEIMAMMQESGDEENR